MLIRCGQGTWLTWTSGISVSGRKVSEQQAHSLSLQSPFSRLQTLTDVSSENRDNKSNDCYSKYNISISISNSPGSDSNCKAPHIRLEATWVSPGGRGVVDTMGVCHPTPQSHFVHQVHAGSSLGGQPVQLRVLFEEERDVSNVNSDLKHLAGARDGLTVQGIVKILHQK